MEEKEHEKSDTDDSDYAPEEDISEASECGSSEAEDEDNYESEQKTDKKSIKNQVKKGTKGKSKNKSRKRKLRNSKLDDNDIDNTESLNNGNDSGLTVEEEKARADSLWQSFLSDTATSSKQPSTKSATVSSSKKEESSDDTLKQNNSKSLSPLVTKTDCKTPITNELKESNTIKQAIPVQSKSRSESSSPSPVQASRKRGGISSILGNLNKKTKLNTLEKSKLEWDRFKEENDLKEEISTYNRGKNGYLEKQDFLQRIDSRQFELEKELRSISKRSAR